jgi:hypothetical protein
MFDFSPFWDYRSTNDVPEIVNWMQLILATSFAGETDLRAFYWARKGLTG